MTLFMMHIQCHAMGADAELLKWLYSHSVGCRWKGVCVCVCVPQSGSRAVFYLGLPAACYLAVEARRGILRTAVVHAAEKGDLSVCLSYSFSVSLSLLFFLCLSLLFSSLILSVSLSLSYLSSLILSVCLSLSLILSLLLFCLCLSVM